MPAFLGSSASSSICRSPICSPSRRTCPWNWPPLWSRWPWPCTPCSSPLSNPAKPLPSSGPDPSDCSLSPASKWPGRAASGRSTPCLIAANWRATWARTRRSTPRRSTTEGWDWIPSIRDRNTGIWQDVTLSATGTVEIGDLNVITTLPKPDMSEADIEIETPLTNTENQEIEGDLTASFDDVKVTRHVKLTPGETVVRLEPADYAAG